MKFIVVALLLVSLAFCAEDFPKKELCLMGCKLLKKDWQRQLCEIGCDQIKADDIMGVLADSEFEGGYRYTPRRRSSSGSYRRPSSGSYRRPTQNYRRQSSQYGRRYPMRRQSTQYGRRYPMRRQSNQYKQPMRRQSTQYGRRYPMRRQSSQYGRRYPMRRQSNQYRQPMRRRYPNQRPQRRQARPQHHEEERPRYREEQKPKRREEKPKRREEKPKRREEKPKHHEEEKPKHREEEKPKHHEEEKPAEGNSDLAKCALDFAKSKVGGCYSQTHRDGNPCYDCSSLVWHAYKHCGLNIGATNTRMYPSSHTKEVSFKDMQAGDVLWRHGHVAMYAGGGRIVQASSPSRGIRNDPYRAGSFEKVYRMH